MNVAPKCGYSRQIVLASLAGLLGESVLRGQVVGQPPTESGTTYTTIAPFEVTGSRIKRTDLEGPAPVRAITRAEIERVGGTGLTDVLREMPESTNLAINEGGTLSFARAATGIDLRGLGAGNTLVLVDGRRLAPNGISALGVVFVDLNRFPAAMIEKIEVLKDGASAIYGADATAGVVNVITRKDFSGAEVALRYGNYFATDGAEVTGSFLGGITRGSIRVGVALTYASRHANAAIDQPFSASADLTDRYRALDPVKYAPQLVPGADSRSRFDFRSNAAPHATVGVPSVAQLEAAGLTDAAILNPWTGERSTYLPGTGGVAKGTLGSVSDFASVPHGHGPARPAPHEFVPRAYPADDSGNRYDFQPFVWNVPETRRRDLMVNFAWDLGPTVNFYAGASAGRNDSTTHLAPSPIDTRTDGVLVPATNYYNPFGIPVAFNFRPVDFGPRVGNIRSTSLSWHAGVKGARREKFEWTAAVSSSTNESIDVAANSMSRRALGEALARETPDAFNIFGGPNFQNDPATLDRLRIAPVRSGDARTTVCDAQLGTGELFSLPWGRVGASFSIEHREETYNITNDLLSTALNDIVGSVRFNDPTRARRRVDAAAAELRAPLVPEGRFRYARTVELSAAARFEKFSGGYDSGVTPYAGLGYRPTRDLLLRASAGKVFRLPTLQQLYGGLLENTATNLPDLRRPVELTGDPWDSAGHVRSVLGGGNPRLRPEKGRTRQAGLVLDVPWRPLQGLSLDLTYGVIEQYDRVNSALSLAFIRESELGSTADLVIREAGTETYTNRTASAIAVLSGPGGVTTGVQPGQTVTVPGRIRHILNSAVNLADQTIRYYDFGLRYELKAGRAGRFSAMSNWTYNDWYAARRFPSDPIETQVGRGIPRFRGQSSLAWQRDVWGAHVGMNYIHRYRDLTRDRYEVQRYYTFSVGVSHVFQGQRILRNTQLAVGIENLFDREPPLVGTPGGVGYDQGFVGRPGGRFGFISLRRSL